MQKIPSIVLLACSALLLAVLFFLPEKEAPTHLAEANNTVEKSELNANIDPSYNPFNVVPPVELGRRKYADLLRQRK